MAKFGQVTFFENWEDASERICESLRLYGIKEAAIYKNGDGKVEISMVGKLPKPVAALIELETGEVIGDYEGIDDATKKTGYVFPVEKCKKLLVDSFGFFGRFLEIPSEEQDPISGEVKKELLYIQKERASESINDLMTEYIESAVNMVDAEDDTESVLQVMFETFNQILDLTGNQNLQQEINGMLLEILTA